MEEITIRQLKRVLRVEDIVQALPCKLTADSQTICVMLKVEQYNKLVAGYKETIHKSKVFQGKRLIKVPELDAEYNT